MKTITASAPASIATRTPDFGGRPRRINLEQTVAAKAHGKLKVRPIRLDDELEMVRFHESLSEEDIYRRYYEYLGLDRRTDHHRLVRICTNTPESYAIVVEKPATRHLPAAILAVGRLTKTDQPLVANFDLLVSEDDTPRLGKILLARLMKLARAFDFHTLTGGLLVVDHDAINLCRSLGFKIQTFPGDGLVLASIDL